MAIIGARPQFIKHCAMQKACEGCFNLIALHTGQHYDKGMSDVFFSQLNIKPEIRLSNSTGSHASQTAKMMIGIEEEILNLKPDAVLVYGDTNSTLAGALVAAKLRLPVIHGEAGLRSFNKAMPEEINRILTDHASDLLFVPNEKAMNQLAAEGLTKGVFVTGDIMKDVWMSVRDKIQKTDVPPYYYATLHRPYNTDEKGRMVKVLKALNELDKNVIFSIHPRTVGAMERYGLKENTYPNIKFVPAQPYLENLSLLSNAAGLITDSGGMQKEAYWMHKPCATIRTETEWMETLSGNANHLFFEDLEAIGQALQMDDIHFKDDLYGDGHAADQMVAYMKEYLN